MIPVPLDGDGQQLLDGRLVALLVDGLDRFVRQLRALSQRKDRTAQKHGETGNPESAAHVHLRKRGQRMLLASTDETKLERQRSAPAARFTFFSRTRPAGRASKGCAETSRHQH